jgi:hypothetical protein
MAELDEMVFLAWQQRMIACPSLLTLPDSDIRVNWTPVARWS